MKKFFKSRFITVVLTIILFFILFSFIYPFFVKPKARIAVTDTYKKPVVVNQTQPVAVESNPIKEPASSSLIAKVAQVFDKPAVVFYGTSNSNFIDPNKFSDGPGLSNLIRNLGNGESAETRNMDMTSFYASKPGYFVYFAWPTSYENGGVQSCNSISFPYELKVGTVDCFSAGGSSNFIFPLTDSFHRTLSKFVDSEGKVVSYELYRAHNPIDSGTKVYFTVY